MKKLMVAILLSTSLSVLADPSPFGLEIGKATIEDVKAKYKLTHTGTNKYSKGDMYTIDTSQINFDGLKDVTLIFSQDDVLLAVLTTLPKTKFESLMNGLGGKYKLVSKQIPFVGNKSAKFLDGNTEITLDSPHLSFQMSMNYINNELLKAFTKQSSLEQLQKEKHEASQL